MRDQITPKRAIAILVSAKLECRPKVARWDFSIVIRNICEILLIFSYWEKSDAGTLTELSCRLSLNCL